MRIIVGLGNPGKEYIGTRHNMGFWVLDRLADEGGGQFKRSRFKAQAAVIEKDERKVVLVKPETFMNLSGEAAEAALRFYKCKPDALLVVHDDLDLPLGRLKFSEGGSSGGHHGIESIIESLGTRGFNRLRLGIGRSAGKSETVDHVLSPFLKEEGPQARQAVELAAEAVDFYLRQGIQAAMNRYHRHAKEEV